MASARRSAGRQASPSRGATLLNLHDYPPLTGGGLALAVQELAGCVTDGCTTLVLSSRLRDHFADDRERLAGRGTVVAARGTRFGLATPRRLAGWLRRTDVIVAHWTFSFRWLSTSGMLLGPVLRRPTVCVVHTCPEHLRYNRLRRLPGWTRRLLLGALARALRRCTAVVALSPSHRAALAGAGIQATHVLPVPVELSTAAGDAGNRRRGCLGSPPTVGIAGELSALKVAEAIPGLLAALTPRYTVRIAGDGPLAARVARAAAALPTAQRARVHLLGCLTPAQMSGFYAGIDCLLVLSRTESQCRVALEAMLAGVIVLAPPVDGVIDVVVDGVTGFVVDTAAPAAVRDTIVRLVRSPDRVGAVRAQARAFAETSSADSRARWRSFLGATLAAAVRGRA